MAKRKNPILPNLRDLEKIVRSLQADVVENPAEYYTEDFDDSDLLADAQKTLFRAKESEYLDEDSDLCGELAEGYVRDLGVSYEEGIDLALETLEQNFREDYGRTPSDLDPSAHWDELLEIEPDLADCCFLSLTIGASGESKRFGAQTGDNSYTGGAYGYPHWAVVNIYASDKPKDVARDIQSQISELWHGSNY